MLRETQSQVDELQARTEASSAERVVEVELLVANAEQEARVESERMLAEAVADGEAVIARAKDEGRALLEQVQEARRRVLADLASRRRALGIQIEQLRAARDEMAASVLGVRDKVDGILAHLERTDEEAWAAAMAVGDQFRPHPADDGPHDQDSVDEATGESPATAESGEGPGAEPGDDAAGVPAAAPSVDELFARIRAGRGRPAGPRRPRRRPRPRRARLPRTPVGRDRAAGGRARGSGGPGSEGRGAERRGAAGPDDKLIARRDELLAPVTARRAARSSAPWATTRTVCSTGSGARRR